MPIEHEHKFILNDYDSLLAQLRKETNEYRIDQLYLSDNARYRRIQRTTNVLDIPRVEGSRADVLAHTFTYKRKIADSVLEHEMEISADDYLLAQAGCVGKLTKLRFKFPGVEAGTFWDVDFLIDEDDKVYFALAECEHDRGTSYTIPDVLQPHIEIAVPEQHTHLFSNRRLVNRQYTDQIVAQYHNGLVTSVNTTGP